MVEWTPSSSNFVRDFEAFPHEVKTRQTIGQAYTSELSKLDFLSTPAVDESSTSVFAQYTILSEHRENIQNS